MPRKPRLFVTSIPYHIVQRGNNKCPIFFDDADYIFFLNILKEAKSRHPCFIYVYCLMVNHFHLLIQPKEKENASLFIKWLGVKYVYYFNKKYERSGTLWEGRFRSCLIESELYFLACLRYIEMNPVRAGLVPSLQQYRWSSYRVRAFGEENSLLDLDPWYESLGSNEQERQWNYRRFFQNTASAAELKLIREMTNKNGIVGSNLFKERIKKMTEEKPGLKNVI